MCGQIVHPRARPARPLPTRPPLAPGPKQPQPDGRNGVPPEEEYRGRVTFENLIAERTRSREDSNTALAARTPSTRRTASRTPTQSTPSVLAPATAGKPRQNDRRGPCRAADSETPDADAGEHGTSQDYRRHRNLRGEQRAESLDDMRVPVPPGACADVTSRTRPARHAGQRPPMTATASPLAMANATTR